MADVAKMAPGAVSWLQDNAGHLLARVMQGDQLASSTAVAETVLAGFSIKSREDMEAASDSARIIKRGVATLEESLKEMFRPLKELERQVRDRARVQAGSKLEVALERIDAERRRWTDVEARQAREQQRREQEQAAAAAEAAARARDAGGLADDEEAPPPAQVPVHKPESTVRGAVATTARVRKAKAVELVNPQEAAEQWGVEVIALNVKLATERYAAKMKLGTLELPKDGGEVVGGVRFVTEVTFSDSARGR